MESAKFLKKKGPNKSKVKKTIKNILCRPDPVPWPTVTDVQSNEIEKILNKHKVDIPLYIKMTWYHIKDVPRLDRPKPPQIKKVNGLIFGMCTCEKTIRNGECAAVMLDNDIDPKMLVHHIIESCHTANIPVICVNNLKKINMKNFGFSTCCLGIKKDSDAMKELLNNVTEITKPNIMNHKSAGDFKLPYSSETIKINEAVQVDKGKLAEKSFSYLYRTSNTSRVFIPQATKSTEVDMNKFSGQNFIKVTDNKQTMPKGKVYKNMYMKRVTNNPNRQKKVNQ